jgi:hypothetical protein
MNDNTFDFQIDEGVDIPKREIQGRPRGSQYPLEQMSPGQSFFLPVEGEEGATRKDKDGNVFELTVEEDLARKLRQKQSYFSQIGKSLGISIVTRTYPTGNAAEYNERYAGMSGLGVWHNGERTEKDSEQEVELEDEAESAE